jgi:hypothetical protein
VSSFSALTAQLQHPASSASQSTTWDMLALPPAWSTSTPKATGGSTANPIAVLDVESMGTLSTTQQLQLVDTHLVTSQGAVVAADGPTMLRSLIGIGAITSRKADDIVTYSVETQKLQWLAPQRLLHCTPALQIGLHMHPMYHPKLAIVLQLLRKGWRVAKAPRPKCLKPGDQTFYFDLKASKFYFVAMMENTFIFSNMRAAHIADVKIMHNMKHSYYMGLVKMSGAKELKALMAMADRNASEDDFHKLLAQHNIADAPIAAVSVAAIATADDDDTVAMQVISGVPEAMVDIANTIQVEFPSPDNLAVHLMRDKLVMGMGKGRGKGRGRGRKGRGRGDPVPGARLSIQVHFDNCCHPSGKQRAFISCPRRDHKNCVKWKNVDMCCSNTRLIGELTAWAMLAATSDESYSKDDHKNDWPSEDQILHYVSKVPTDLDAV